MLLFAILVIYSITKKESLDYTRIVVTLFQIICWAFSDLILLFEYRRALGHIWYMHPTFIWLSILIYSVDLVYSLYAEILDVTNPSEPIKTFVLLALILLIMLSTIALGVLVCVYKNDLPFERRHYMTVSKPPYELPSYLVDHNS